MHGTVAFIPEDDGMTELERSLITNPTAGRTLLIVVRNINKARMISTMMSIDRAEQTDIAVLGDPNDRMAAAAILSWMEGIPMVDIDITFAPSVVAATVAGLKFMREGIKIAVTLGSGRMDVDPNHRVNVSLGWLDCNISIRTDVAFRPVRVQRAMLTASPI